MQFPQLQKQRSFIEMVSDDVQRDFEIWMGNNPPSSQVRIEMDSINISQLNFSVQVSKGSITETFPVSINFRDSPLSISSLHPSLERFNNQVSEEKKKGGVGGTGAGAGAGCVN